MKMIMPCCGNSTRYPNQPPKWMLPAPNGEPMLTRSASGLRVDIDDVVVVILRQHDEQYGAAAGIRDAFRHDVRIVVLDTPTRSQPETVAEALRSLRLDEPFLIKDSDNRFELTDLEQDDCYVSVDSLNNHELINPRNKSYVQVDHNATITNIREKEVISDLFSVGGYFFTNPSHFLETYDRLVHAETAWHHEFYISDIVAAMILDGVPVTARRVENYQDWGTVHEWRRTLLASRTIFAALDGFVLERGNEHFSPRYSDVRPHTAVVEELLEARRRGHTIVLLSIRPPELEAMTQASLKEVGLGDVPVVYGCQSTAWRLIGAPHAVLPFQTVEAVELEPDDPNLHERLL